MTAKLKGVEKFAAQMRRMGDRYLDEVTRALDFVAVRGLKSLQSTRRFNDRTGRLRASFQAAGEAPYRRRLSADTHYAYYVENGTARMRKRPYMADARKVVERELPRAMNDMLRKISKG